MVMVKRLLTKLIDVLLIVSWNVLVMVKTNTFSILMLSFFLSSSSYCRNILMKKKSVRQFTYVLGMIIIGGRVVIGLLAMIVISEQPINVSFSLPKPGPDLLVSGSLPQLFPVVYFH